MGVKPPSVGDEGAGTGVVGSTGVLGLGFQLGMLGLEGVDGTLGVGGSGGMGSDVGGLGSGGMVWDGVEGGFPPEGGEGVWPPFEPPDGGDLVNTLVRGHSQRDQSEGHSFFQFFQLSGHELQSLDQELGQSVGQS